MSDFSARLREARELVSDLSARGLDELAGLTHGHTWMIESGQRGEPELKTAAKLAKTLGVSLDWLAFGTGEAPTEELVRHAVDKARAEAAA